MSHNHHAREFECEQHGTKLVLRRGLYRARKAVEGRHTPNKRRRAVEAGLGRPGKSRRKVSRLQLTFPTWISVQLYFAFDPSDIDRVSFSSLASTFITRSSSGDLQEAHGPLYTIIAQSHHGKVLGYRHDRNQSGCGKHSETRNSTFGYTLA